MRLSTTIGLLSKTVSKCVWCIASLLLVTTQAQAETYYFHNDQLGTPQVVTDNTQQVVWKGEYGPFGECTETINLVEQNIRFPGQYFDEETGLHYNYFRTYDVTLGRYLVSDPAKLIGGLNTYGYVNQNPVNNYDEEGLFAVQVIKIIVKKTLKRKAKSPRKSPTKPDRRKGVWNCAVVACCNDNIPGNCPDDPSQHCKQAVWRDINRATAIRKAEALAKKRLGCQTKHVTVRCTGPKGEPYSRGG